MLEDKIKSKIALNRNMKENLRLYSAMLTLSSMISCNSFNYAQHIKELTIACSPTQTLYCSKPAGYAQNDCTCYDNMILPSQVDPWARIW